MWSGRLRLRAMLPGRFLDVDVKLTHMHSKLGGPRGSVKWGLQLWESRIHARASYLRTLLWNHGKLLRLAPTATRLASTGLCNARHTCPDSGRAAADMLSTAESIAPALVASETGRHAPLACVLRLPPCDAVQPCEYWLIRLQPSIGLALSCHCARRCSSAAWDDVEACRQASGVLALRPAWASLPAPSRRPITSSFGPSAGP
jgi:hypothetical protein